MLRRIRPDRVLSDCSSVPWASHPRYHINLRLNLARRLLRETKQSIVEIALEVGYVTSSHFAQLFRRETGLSPSDYRRQR
jgi:AraC family transcriptional regulator